MAYPISARLAVLSLVALTGACSTIKSYMPQSGEAAEQTAASAPSVYSPAPAAPAPQSHPQLRPATDSNRGYGTEYDSNPVAVPIKPGAPDRYTVVRGDTLWDISGLFLEDPWLWPEIWYVNPQIDNPHLIYPGDVLSLVWVDGRPQIRIDRGGVSADVRLSPEVRYQSLEDAIPTIPYDAIAGFLSKPTVLDKKTVRRSPYIVDIRESHLIAGSGFHVYVRGTDAPAGTRFHVYNVGDELFDPDSGRLLGFEGLYVGEGRIEETGDPSTLFLTETRREALKGDILILEDPKLPLSFFPRAPEQPVEGRIISVVDGVSLIGTYQIVSINRGSNHGIATGHVLSVYETGEVIHDRFAQAGGFSSLFRRKKLQLPDKHAGEMMVFRVAEEISYGLIMHATSEINVLDTVRNPE
ncbi:MAG: LysM peptidoglycan-binding domain-containing protein [Gammaproteobacteria bacterium]|nr:LysM peptidoglycan-binding domain-containing protein [Gammaproteobacteria bacterium]NNF60352.1 LysM peptidoglycan-binding domain-containing protein [Gammaproteobacteria bacterium]NNM20604.1 LysM peptidoglycan-binding domain-containing protein [Gammaproteobacteria bacterium]